MASRYDSPPNINTISGPISIKPIHPIVKAITYLGITFLMLSTSFFSSLSKNHGTHAWLSDDNITVITIAIVYAIEYNAAFFAPHN